MQSINHGDDDVQREASSMSLFQGSSNFGIHNSSINQIHGNANLTHIYGNITVIRFGDEQFTQDQKDSIREIISSHVDLPDINHNLNSKQFLTQLIINLPRAEAVFNDYQNKKKSGPCFEGTRVALLREMADWVTGSDEFRMYILSGLAGIGKSTVAYTIASRTANLNLLGASFFFSRDEADRNNAKKLFTTIAYQLCVYNEAFAKAIGDALQTERGSAATTKDPQEQLQALILDPLRSVVHSHTRPILVVIDALDECDEDDQYTVIMGLNQLVRDLLLFKVILTTRPKPYLDHFMRNQRGHKLFHLQDIEDKVVNGDIRLYLEHSLSLEQVQNRFLKQKWCASEEEIDSLVHAAGRLFIIASTAVRYILDKFAGDPAAQMRNLLRASPEDRISYKDLDRFYTTILRNAIPVDCDNDGIVNRYQLVVGAIIFVQRPLPVSTLSHLIHMDEKEIRVVLDHLQSVILLGNDDMPQIYHKSFPDYLTNQARCKDAHLRIDPKLHHRQIASRCFEITNKNLKYNILRFSKTARYMSNKDGLNEDGITDEQVLEKIPQELRYACVYWANHLQVATIENNDIMNGLTTFVREHTLHWIEVLSIIGNLDSAHRALRLALKLLDSMSSDLQQLLSDALRFTLKFYEIIERSALHTYYSALPFSPTDSLLYRQFIKEAEDKICVIEGGLEKWNALVASLSHEKDAVHAFIKFSHDSALICSCSEKLVDGSLYEPGYLKIWDAATGVPISTIPGARFAVSNDFSTIASSENNLITYYNTNGSERGTTNFTSSKIKKLAISSDRIAAALADGDVWLWESRNGKLIGSFDGYESDESPYFFSSTLQFSSTGTRFAYSSANGSIKLQDGTSGRLIANLQCGSNHKFAFSEDGSRIASLSSNGDLTLWNSESGALIGAVRNVGSKGLAISKNGSLLATAGLDYVTLWSENHDHLAQIEELKFRYASSVAFSVDDILAIADSFIIKLYNVKTHSFISTIPSGRSSKALAFSPDCTHFACKSDTQMSLWNIQDMDTSSPPSNEVAAITAIALSRDCSHLACKYGDGRVELWSTSPAMQRIASYQLHEVQSNIMFGPDGRLFACESFDGTIQLWNSGDGLLHGTIQAPHELKAVALSNNMLVAVGNGDITLWNIDTLSLGHAFQTSGKYSISAVSISDESDVLAIGYGRSVDLFDVERRIKIATLEVHGRGSFRKLAFLPDKSHLVVLFNTGASLSFNLISKSITEGPIFEHLIQLPDIPLWDGIPILHSWHEEQHHLSALFSQQKNLVPVLWIPRNFPFWTWTEGSSMIAFGCTDGRIVLLRLSTSDKDSNRVSRQIHYPGCSDTRFGGASSNTSNALRSTNQQHVSSSQTADKHAPNPTNKSADKEDRLPLSNSYRESFQLYGLIRRYLFGHFWRGGDNTRDGYSFDGDNETELMDVMGVD